MTKNEFCKYWHPVLMKMQPAGYPASVKLAALLNMDYPYGEAWKDIELTDNQKRTVEMLNSPHFETMLKIIQARRTKSEN